MVFSSCSNRICLYVFICSIVCCASTGYSQDNYLSFSEYSQNTIDHKYKIESNGLFRLVFDASYNYGLSEWYDLSDPENSSKNITKNITDNSPSAEQGSLFNQGVALIDGGDYGTVGISSKMLYPHHPRKLISTECNSVRAIIETEYYLKENIKHVFFKTKYVIYSDGKIFITNKIKSLDGSAIKLWRSITGLGDPSYLTLSDSGTAHINDGVVVDSTKNWKHDKWVGYSFNQPGYNAWEIVSNTNNSIKLGKRINGNLLPVSGTYSILSRDNKFGWIRSTDLHDPYRWSNNRAKYLYMYWDPYTPKPYNNWTKASVMLVPFHNNPYQGGGHALHGWKGFKRISYNTRDLKLNKGQDVTQHYMIQLGTKGSSVLPDLSNSKTVAMYAADYLGDHQLDVAKGAIIGEGYDVEEGVYTLRAENSHKLSFVMNGSVTKLIKPVFKVQNYKSNAAPQIRVNGKLMTPKSDFIFHQLDGNTMLIQLLVDIERNALVEIN